jgi:hypothetical protein
MGILGRHPSEIEKREIGVETKAVFWLNARIDELTDG